MPNATAMSVARDDGTNVSLIPVSSFTEKGVTSVLFRELSTTKPRAACITCTLTAELLKSGVMKTSRKLEIPVMEIIPANAVNSDGRVAAPKVSHVETDIRVRYHAAQSTSTERADSYRMASHIDIGGSTNANTGVNPSLVTAFTYRDAALANQTLYGDINFVWPSA